MFGSLSWYGTKFIFLDHSRFWVLLPLLIRFILNGAITVVDSLFAHGAVI